MVHYLRYQNSNDWIPGSCMLRHLIISLSLKAKMFTLQIRNVEFSKLNFKVSSRHLIAGSFLRKLDNTLLRNNLWKPLMLLAAHFYLEVKGSCWWNGASTLSLHSLLFLFMLINDYHLFYLVFPNTKKKTMTSVFIHYNWHYYYSQY